VPYASGFSFGRPLGTDFNTAPASRRPQPNNLGELPVLWWAFCRESARRSADPLTGGLPLLQRGPRRGAARYVCTDPAFGKEPLPPAEVDRAEPGYDLGSTSATSTSRSVKLRKKPPKKTN
jgi:hypothetical protein